MYDLDKILNYVISQKIDISPEQEGDWAMFCCALKVLGYDLGTFFSLSHCTRGACETKWNAMKSPERYTNPSKARAKLIALARERGVMVDLFKTEGDHRPTPRPTAKEDFADIGSEKQPPIFVTSEVVGRMQAKVKDTALYNFLCSHFPPSKVDEVMTLYKVGGTSRFGGLPPSLASTFPYINHRGECIDIHLQPYQENGERYREGYSQDWELRVEGNKERRGKWCLFGEHLLSQRPHAPVGVVESEKTAIICAIYCPTFVWVATASLTNLTPQRCEGAKGRDLYLFPDRDGVESWRARAQRLNAEGYKIYLCSGIITSRARHPKDDLADIILRETEEDL